MVKRMSILAVLAVVSVALPGFAQNMAKGAPASITAKSSADLQTCSVGSKLVFTNLQGPNHRAYNTSTGYFVDGSSFDNQVLGQGFTPSSSVTFSDVLMPMGVYTNGGGQNNAGTINVYLMSDSGGVPGSIIEGPLTRCQGIANFNNGRGGNMIEFDCVTCTSTLASGTQYWIVAQQTTADVQLTWDETRAQTDLESPFVFNQVGSLTGSWLVVSGGFSRAAYEVDGN
jgi:hypothetical protein